MSFHNTIAIFDMKKKIKSIQLEKKMGKKPKNWSYLGGYFTYRLHPQEKHPQTRPDISLMYKEHVSCNSPPPN